MYERRIAGVCNWRNPEIFGAARQGREALMNLPDLTARAFSHYHRGEFKRAEQVARQILAVQPSDPNLIQLLAAALVAQSQADAAADLLDKLVRSGFRAGEVLYNLGTALMMAGRHDEAAQRLGQAAEANPRNPDYQNNLGLALLMARRHREAEGAFERACSLRPNWPAAVFNRGRARAIQGRHQEALDDYSRATGSSKSVPPELLLSMGFSLHALGRSTEALETYDRLLAVEPGSAEAHNDRGSILFDLKRPSDALAAYSHALALKPKFPDAWGNRGNALLELRRPSEALASFDQAVAIKPDLVAGHHGRGIALTRLDRVAEAIASFDRALTIDPGNANTHHCRGNALQQQGCLDEALASYSRALTSKPDATPSLTSCAYMALCICDWTTLEGLRADWLASCRLPSFNGACFPVLLVSDDPALHLAAARSHVSNNLRAVSKDSGTVAARGDGKLRIGYLSADFGKHPVASLIAELIEVHDRSRFSVYGFAASIDDQSSMRRRLGNAFDAFIDVAGAADDELVEIVRKAKIDILVDLGGHTHNNRLMALAERPSPVQVTYLGYPGTTGAPFIDYAIVDKFVIAPGEDKHFTEKLVYLPDCYQANDRKRAVSDRVFSRKECGLPQNAFVFCCFNHPNKFSGTVFDVWTRILRAVPESVLWLLEANSCATENLRKEARARNIEPGRLIFAPKMEAADHLARMQLADLFLDTWPYNAHTTASDALWVGLPLITYSGRSFASRVAGSLLQSVGMPELVTYSTADYEALALRLASAPGAITALRGKLRANVATEPLFDTDRFRRHIEAAFLQMWDRHRAGDQQASFAVSAAL